MPLDGEAIPAELNPGDALIFVGNMYHAGGGNTTKFVIPIREDVVFELLTMSTERKRGRRSEFSCLNLSTAKQRTNT